MAGGVEVRNRMLFAIDLNLGVGMLVFGLVVCIAIEVSTGIGVGIEEEGIWKFVGIEQSFDYLSALSLITRLQMVRS